MRGLKTINLLIISLLCFEMIAQTTNVDNITNTNDARAKQDSLNFIESFKESLTLGGRIMYDYNQINHYDPDRSFTGSEFRRARFEASGEVAKNIGFQFQAEFADAKIRFKAMNLYFKNLPVIGGQLFIGNIHEPFSLDQLTSSKYITFIERATPTSFILKWRNGFLYENFSFFNKRVGLQLAYTANGSEPGAVNFALSEGSNMSGRISSRVIDNREKKQLLHLGLSYSRRNPIKITETNDREYILVVKPESHMALPSLFHVFKQVKHTNVTGVEAAYNWGALSLQGEYVYGKVFTADKNYSVPSYYAYVSYFLTKEHRPYKYKENVMARVKPKSDFNFKNNWGALELAVRYSYFDLTSVAPENKLQNITLGLNWYLNPKTRIMYNYIISDEQGPEKNNIHLLRFQIDFGKTFK